MLEKGNLKSQFYLDHTFYSSPTHHQVSFKNLQEPNTSLHIPSSKTPKNTLNLTSNHKIDISFQEDPSIQDLNRSLNPSRIHENLTLKSSKKLKISYFCPSSIKSKSIRGIKIKKLKNSENFKQPKISPRVQTPYFNKRFKNTVSEIKGLCDKLAHDQSRVKKPIKHSNFSPKQELSDLQSPKTQLTSFPKIFRFDLLNNSIKPNEKLNHGENLIRASVSPIDQHMRFNSPNPVYTESDPIRQKLPQHSRHSIRSSKKYYKDQPMIKSVLGVPKEVFTPKQCN